MTREEYEAKIDEKLINAFEEIEERLIEFKKELMSEFKVDAFRITHGYAKKTAEEVNFQMERDEVLYELSKYAEPKDAEWDGIKNHSFICWDYHNNKIHISACSAFRRNEIYFTSEEDAEKAIVHCGEERVKKYYLGVEE